MGLIRLKISCVCETEYSCYSLKLKRVHAWCFCKEIPLPPQFEAKCFILSPKRLNVGQPLKNSCLMYLCPGEFPRISPLHTPIAFLPFPQRIPAFPILPLQKSRNPLPLSQERIPLLLNRGWAITNIFIRRQVSQSTNL